MSTRQNSKIITVVLMPLLTLGCLTTSKFTTTLLNNWGMSSDKIAKKVEQKPWEEGRLYDSDVTFQRYWFIDPWEGQKDYILYYDSERLIRCVEYTEVNHYEAMYELGVISIEKYKNYLNLRRKQLEYEVQRNYVRKQQEYQRQILKNQTLI